jgi:hypothetical protein
MWDRPNLPIVPSALVFAFLEPNLILFMLGVLFLFIVCIFVCS